MTDAQWNALLAVLRGELLDPPPVGFIIDCPWLPAWAGVDLTDYLASETIWLEANRRAVETFPDAWFLPGFWAEFGMCTEPSAFGARCRFRQGEFPFPEPVARSIEELLEQPPPDPAADGLLPLVLARMRWAQPRLAALGHKIRFSVSRGPLNVASFLLGMTGFLTALKTEPDAAQRLLERITDFLKRWHALQRRCFPEIDGRFVLDDVVGFLSETDFLKFAFPWLKELFAADVSVKFFHNDAACAQSLRHYAAAGINLFNPGSQNPARQLRELAGPELTLLGNLPARDLLAAGTPQQVHAAVRQWLRDNPDRRRWILSCGGGMPPGVPTANLRAFLAAARGRSLSQTETAAGPTRSLTIAATNP
jgi:uroporphyrinogen decarboxylase